MVLYQPTIGVPRDLSLARRNDGLEEILPLLDGGDAANVLEYAGAFVLAADDADAIGTELARAAKQGGARHDQRVARFGRKDANAHAIGHAQLIVFAQPLERVGGKLHDHFDTLLLHAQ